MCVCVSVDVTIWKFPTIICYDDCLFVFSLPAFRQLLEEEEKSGMWKLTRIYTKFRYIVSSVDVSTEWISTT